MDFLTEKTRFCINTLNIYNLNVHSVMSDARMTGYTVNVL